MAEPTISIQGERLRVLDRFYAPEVSDEDQSALTAEQRLVFSCMYSRHHDGFVRERHLRAIKGSEPWLAPFMLLLVSDYVIEICQVALENVNAVPSDVYGAFAAENPEFMHRIRARVVSYAYLHGSMHERFTTYPGYRFLADLGLWTGQEARDWLRQAGDS